MNKSGPLPPPIPGTVITAEWGRRMLANQAEIAQQLANYTQTIRHHRPVHVGPMPACRACGAPYEPGRCSYCLTPS